MSNVTLPPTPRQAQSTEPEPNPLHELRRRRAVAVAPTVRAESAGLQDLKQAMQLCLNAAYGVCEGLEVDLPFTTEDVRVLGITLFLECSRKGILPQESTEGRPWRPFAIRLEG